GMVAIAAGPFIFGGIGDPPSKMLEQYPAQAVEHRISLSAFSIDRTEVTNAAFAVFGGLSSTTGIAAPSYPVVLGLEHVGDPARPVGNLTWAEARAYCRFLGKQLPTTEQWERALRGGERLADNSPNLMPRRSFPWGAPVTPLPANLKDTGDG